MTWLLLAAGLVLLLGSGEFLVRAAAGVARALGVSPLFIGLTLVGFGTSSPAWSPRSEARPASPWATSSAATSPTSC